MNEKRAGTQLAGGSQFKKGFIITFQYVDNVKTGMWTTL